MLKRLLELPDDNPIFLQEVRAVKWIRTPQGITGYTRTAGLIVILVALAIVALVVAAAYFSATPEEDLATTIQVGLFFLGNYIAGDIVNTGFIPALGAIFFAIGLISEDKTSNRLDLVRLAAGEANLVAGRHGIALVRAWRLTVIWVAARLAGTLMMVLAGVLFLLQADLETFFQVELGIPFETAWLWFALPVLLPIDIAYLAYTLLEPVWEVRALTALGINVSTRTETRGGAIALGVVGWVVMNTLLGIVYVVFFLPVAVLYSALIFGQSSNNLEQWLPYILVGGLVGVPLYVGFGAFLVYIFYRTVRRRLLRNAVTRLVNEA